MTDTHSEQTHTRCIGGLRPELRPTPQLDPVSGIAGGVRHAARAVGGGAVEAFSAAADAPFLEVVLGNLEVFV